MKLRFLCAGHREWLSKSPAQAVDCWSNGLETGKILCGQFQWKEALAHIGCAYEASEIILSTTYVDRYNAVHFFTSSSVMLINVLSQVGCYDDSWQVCLSAMERLRRELLTDGCDRPHIIHQLKRLDMELEKLPEHGHEIDDYTTYTPTIQHTQQVNHVIH